MSRAPHRNGTRHLGPMPQFASNGKAWTEEDYLRLRVLREDEKLVWRVIALAMQRPEADCVKKYIARFRPDDDGSKPPVFPKAIAPWPKRALFGGPRNHALATWRNLHEFHPDPRYRIPPPVGRSSMSSAAQLCVDHIGTEMRQRSGRIANWSRP